MYAETPQGLTRVAKRLLTEGARILQKWEEESLKTTPYIYPPERPPIFLCDDFVMTPS